jgi:hypothetical protein
MFPYNAKAPKSHFFFIPCLSTRLGKRLVHSSASALDLTGMTVWLAIPLVLNAPAVGRLQAGRVEQHFPIYQFLVVRRPRGKELPLSPLPASVSFVACTTIRNRSVVSPYLYVERGNANSTA